MKLNNKITIILTAAIIIVGFLISSVLTNQKEPITRKAKKEKAVNLKTLTVETRTMRPEIEASGRLYAREKIEIFAEVTGVLEETPKQFRAGYAFKAGETMIRIDDAVYRNNLMAQKSSLLNQMTLLLPDLRIDYPESAKLWEAYLAGFDLNQPLAPLPEAQRDQEKYYIASKNIYNLYYSVMSMEATLAKYELKAPYDGVVTESYINPGMLVRPGQKIGAFLSPAVYELEAPVSFEDSRYLQTGATVRLTSADLRESFSGTLSRINPSIDQKTQTIMVFITTTDQRLRDGMFLTAHIPGQTVRNAAEIPRNLISDDRHVYVFDDSLLTKQEVDIISRSGEMVIVTGLADGMQILNQEFDNALNGYLKPELVAN